MLLTPSSPVSSTHVVRRKGRKAVRLRRQEHGGDLGHHRLLDALGYTPNSLQLLDRLLDALTPDKETTTDDR